MTDAVLVRVRDHLRTRVERVTETRVTVGPRATLVECTDPDDGRLAGLAHRPPGEPPATWPTTAPNLAALATADTALPRAVGVATLNALSAPELDWQVGDPMATLPNEVETVATVGLFRPALRTFADVTVRVVERDPPATVDAPPGVTVETYRPQDGEAAFADADVCFLTGSVLVYGGLDRYLDALSDRDVSPVVLVGATASCWPDPLFAAGVDVVAGARVTAPETVRRRVLAGDCGTDLHDHGVEKVFVEHE